MIVYSSDFFPINSCHTNWQKNEQYRQYHKLFFNIQVTICVWTKQCFNKISEGHYSESLRERQNIKIICLQETWTKGLGRIAGRNIQLSSLDKKFNSCQKYLLSAKIYETLIMSKGHLSKKLILVTSGILFLVFIHHSHLFSSSGVWPVFICFHVQVLDLGGNNLQILPREVFSRHGLLNLQKLKVCAFCRDVYCWILKLFFSSPLWIGFFSLFLWNFFLEALRDVCAQKLHHSSSAFHISSFWFSVFWCSFWQQKLRQALSYHNFLKIGLNS